MGDERQYDENSCSHHVAGGQNIETRGGYLAILAVPGQEGSV